MIVGLAPLPMALAGGSLIFVIVVVVIFFAIAFGYYTVRGSGVSLTPYRRAGGPPESPPQVGHDITTNVRNWTRGTEGHHARHRPPATREPVDPAVADALREWRAGSETVPHLEPPPAAGDHLMGPPTAPVVAVYLDLASAPCRAAWQLLMRLAAARPARLLVRHLPLADVHPLALGAAETLEAASEQGRFFDLLDVLAERPAADETALLDIAGRVVHDPVRLRAEVEQGVYHARVVEDIREATASGVQVIPEFFIEGRHYAGLVRFDELRRAVDAVA